MYVRRNARTPKRKAVATVEFAVILPLLMLLVLGCVDFGRVAHSYIAVTNAARSAIGYAIVHPFTPRSQAQWVTNVQSVAANEMQLIPGFDASTVVVNTATDPQGVTQVSVSVTYRFQLITPWPSLPHTVTMNRQVVMRHIRY